MRIEDPSRFLAARIAAFVSAHDTIRLCAACLPGKPARRAINAGRIQEPGWCVACGARGAVGFAVPVGEYVTQPRGSRLGRNGSNGSAPIPKS